MAKSARSQPAPKLYRHNERPPIVHAELYRHAPKLILGFGDPILILGCWISFMDFWKVTQFLDLEHLIWPLPRSLRSHSNGPPIPECMWKENIRSSSCESKCPLLCPSVIISLMAIGSLYLWPLLLCCIFSYHLLDPYAKSQHGI